MEGETKSIQLPKPIELFLDTYGLFGQGNYDKILLFNETGERIEWQVPRNISAYKGAKIAIKSKRIEGLQGFIEINDSRKNLHRKAIITHVPAWVKRIIVVRDSRSSRNRYVKHYEYDFQTGELKEVEWIEEMEVD